MGKRKIQKSIAQDAFAFDASQFGDTIKSPEIKPMKKKKKLKTHNPQSVYQQWEFNDLTQPSQPISRYQEDSPPPSPPSFEDSPLPSAPTESMSPSITKHHHIILSEQLSVEKVPNELSSEVPNFIIVEKVPNEPSSEVPDFIPAMITQANTQEENNDKICIRNIQPKNRTHRMDANIPKLFSTKSVNKKVLKTTKDIWLSQEPSLTKHKQYNKMFRRSNPHNDNKPSLKNEILREVGLIHKKTRPTKDKAPVSILSRAITKQMSGTRPKKQVRYEEKKESPVVRRKEYKAIPLQIILTKQTITLPQTHSKVQQHRQSQAQQHRQSKVQQQKQSKVQQHNIHPLKKLPPLRRRPIITNKSFSKSKKPSKSTKPKTVVSKLQKEVVFCADSEDEFKNLTGYEKRQLKSIDYSSQLEFKRGVKAVPAMLACAHVSEEFTRVQFEVSVLRKKWGNERWSCQNKNNEH